MAKIEQSTNELLDVLTENWSNDERVSLPYSGGAVRRALQAKLKEIDGKKIGYCCWSNTVDGSSFYHLWGFAKRDDYLAYITDPVANAALLLLDEALPISTVQGDSYGAYLSTTIGGTKDIVVSGDTLNVPLRFHAVRTSNGERLNVGVAATLVIQRSVDGGNTWTTAETRLSAVPSTDYADTATFTALNVAGCLVNGKQKLRIRAQFEHTAEDGSAKTATSVYVAVGNSVTKTNLSLTCQLNWQTPLLASVYASKGYPISYMVYGSCAKTLHILITGGNNTTMPEITYPLSASDDSTTISKNISDAVDSYKLLKHGVRTVKAWLTCDDGLGNTITSAVLVNRFMVVDPATAADINRPYLMLQNIITTADNYTQTDICQYAVFSPAVDESGNVINAGPSVPVIFYLTDYAENFPSDNPTEYFKMENNSLPGAVNTLNTTIEIESADDAATTLSSYFRVYRRDADGNEVNFLQESQNANNLVILVDNSDSYAPKAGADFLLNPKVRNNTEPTPARILNARANNAEVESMWTGFGFVNDGWITSEQDGQKVLRIPSGAKINFKYNPFAQFLTTADSSMTLEIDFAVRNVTNEADPIISLFESIVTTTSGGTVTTFRGLRMKPMSGNIYTKSNTVDSETDFSWREGVRTHIAINIHNAVSPNKGDVLVPDVASGLNIAATKIALVRVFINGDIEREQKYSITDSEEFATSAMGNGGFTLGQDGSDLDIYSIRCYQNNALETTEVFDNYVSTLPTTERKNAKRERNNIMTSGKVDINKVHAIGIRTLTWHGSTPYHESTSRQTGWYEIRQYDKQGNYLPEYSGTICKETKSLLSTRQGSTANTYYWSNQQTKCGDVKATIRVAIADFHPSISVSAPYEVTTDTGTKQVVAISGGNLGKYDPVQAKPVEYDYDNGLVTVPDGWIDDTGKYRGMGYQVAENTPMASKLVNKINYASSMQSHLTGANNLYNDLHTAIVGKNSLQEACPTARVSKYTEPFMYFTQEEGQSAPMYNGPCTFGAGKMDKPTWGYVKKLHPNFTMIEGSDNNYDLTDFRVPFTYNQEGCHENIIYKGGDYEGFFYNGKQCLDVDAAATQGDAEETPIEPIITAIQGMANFLYLHSPMINYYKGTFEAFQASDASKDIFNKYWCTDGSEAYKLKRYNFVDGRWEDAGLWDSAKRTWSAIDLRTDAMTAATFGGSANQSQYAALNAEFRAAIVSHAQKYLGFYFKADSLKLYYTFIIHLLAGTDSCSKNTYYVLDPKVVPVTIDGETRNCMLFELHTDDVDTLLPIDNNGRSTKPYYIDRMHPYVDGDITTEKYEGMHNVLFNLCEGMWEGTKELQAMMKRILSTMESLVKETDYIQGWPGGSKVSVMGCMWKYFYYVHNYFPEMAYNEAARIRYEYPEMLGFVSSGSGARGVKPITQSNGSLMQCELQFIIRRLVLMASYAAWGPFFDGKTGSLGIAEATDSFSMQAFHLPDSATSNNNYTFNVTPHQYIYPVGMMGQTNIDPHVRVAPGQAYALNLGDTTSNDTGMAVLGINFYRSIGNIGNLSTTPANTLTVKGARLTEFIAEPSVTYVDSDTGKAVPAFRPGGIVISATNVQKLSLKGVTPILGAIDLSNLKRLKTVDLRQTNFSDVTLPETELITDVQLPATVTGVSVVNQKALSTLTLESYANLVKFVVKGNTLINTYAHVMNIYTAKPSRLRTVIIDNVAWNTSTKRLPTDALMYLAGLSADLLGIIELSDPKIDRYLSFSDKVALGRKYGNIDDANNKLYIKYTVQPITAVRVFGEVFLSELRDYNYQIDVVPTVGNDIAISSEGVPMITWSIDEEAAPFARFNDSSAGTLTLIANELLESEHAITVKLVKTDATFVETTERVVLRAHKPKLGDIVYGDGVIDFYNHRNRDIVGIVYLVEELEDRYKVHAVHPTYVPLGGKFSKGIYYGDDTNGFRSVASEIDAAIGTTGNDISDVPNLPYNGNNPTLDTYKDNTQLDGFAKYNQLCAGNDFNGKDETTATYNHAKKLVTQYLGKPMPTTLDDYIQAMTNIVSEYGDAKYSGFYHPVMAAVYFEPPVKFRPLSDNLKKGNWHSPALGEAERIVYYYYMGLTADKAVDGYTKDADTPIYANAARLLGRQLLVANINLSISTVSELSDLRYEDVAFNNHVYIYAKYIGISHFYPCVTLDIMK